MQWPRAHRSCERSLYFFRTFGKKKAPGKPMPHGTFHGYERHTFRSEATHGGTRYKSARSHQEPERRSTAAHQLTHCEIWPGRWQAADKVNRMENDGESWNVPRPKKRPMNDFFISWKYRAKKQKEKKLAVILQAGRAYFAENIHVENRAWGLE